MKPFYYTCEDCGHEWQSDDFTETHCPECDGTKIEFEEIHAN